MARSGRKARRMGARLKAVQAVKKESAKNLITEANKALDPLENIPTLKTLNVDDLSLVMTCNRAMEFREEILDWAFLLTESNMKQHYLEAGWGWHPDEKRNELRHSQAWYLLIQDLEGNPKAFNHFRFVIDFDEPVIYCFELQVDPSVQRKGIGRHLMNALQQIAKQFQMNKVMLTVLKRNVNAYKFYTRILNFKIDETSPSKFSEDCCYEILSQNV